MRRWPVSLWLAVLTLALSPTWVSAHAINVECTRRGNKVELEAYYDDDTPAIKAKVLVLNAKVEVVLSGITDAKGRWRFTTPVAGKYEVRVDAGAGHRANTTIHIAEDSASRETGETVSEGPTHAEFTGTPWLKVLIGLVIIGGCGGAFVLASYLRRIH
jgi:hypothetical protein